MHIYEFIPFDKKVISLRKDYKKLLIKMRLGRIEPLIFGESDKFKQVEILLSTKFKNKEYEYDDYDPRIIDSQDLAIIVKGYDLMLQDYKFLKIKLYFIMKIYLLKFFFNYNFFTFNSNSFKKF